MTGAGGAAEGLLCVECGEPSPITPCPRCSHRIDLAMIARDEMMRWKRAPSLSRGRL